jgi:addiction module HigA family antidote
VSRPPIHPGAILADELKEIGVSPTELARQIKVPANRLSQIINGKRAITGDAPIRMVSPFSTYFVEELGSWWLATSAAR